MYMNESGKYTNGGMMSTYKPVPVEKIPEHIMRAYLQHATSYDTITACHEISSGRAYHLAAYNTYTHQHYTLVITYRGTVLDRLEAVNA